MRVYIIVMLVLFYVFPWLGIAEEPSVKECIIISTIALYLRLGSRQRLGDAMVRFGRKLRILGGENLPADPFAEPARPMPTEKTDADK